MLRMIFVKAQLQLQPAHPVPQKSGPAIVPTPEFKQPDHAEAHKGGSCTRSPVTSMLQ